MSQGEDDVDQQQSPMLCNKKKKYSPVSLSLTSSDTEMEEDSYKRSKLSTIESIKRQLHSKIKRGASSATEGEDGEDETRDTTSMGDISSDGGAEAEVRDDILNRVVKGFNQER